MDDPIAVLREELPIRTPADAAVVAAGLFRRNHPGSLVAVFLDDDDRIVDLLHLADGGDCVAHVVDLLCQLPLLGVEALLLISDRTGEVPADRSDDELTWMEVVDRADAAGLVLLDWLIVSGRYAFSAAEHAPFGAQWERSVW